MNKRVLLIQLSIVAADLSSALRDDLDLSVEDRAFIENHLLMMRVAYSEWKGRNVKYNPVEGRTAQGLGDEWRRFSTWSRARPEVRTFVEAAHELSSGKSLPLSDHELEQLRDGLARMQKALQSPASGKKLDPDRHS
jgi:hypothetical protein